MNNTKIKICGMINLEDIEAVNKSKPEFVGFVLFFPKSKRNLDMNTATQLKRALNRDIKSVAVVVSPTAEQVKEICAAEFDYIQIHGKLEENVVNLCTIPIIKAFNVSDMDSFSYFSKLEKIAGYVFDASAPGSGKTFDWSLLDGIKRDEKMFVLSGGLNPDNIKEAIEKIKPDLVDVSSGVEYGDKPGKDPDKIESFIRAVRIY